jgi:hypothetical protein
MTDELPSGLRDLDHRLRSIRFRPRESLGPELLGRLRRGEPPQSSGGRGFRGYLVIAVAAVLTAGTVLLFAHFAPLAATARVTVDRCCFDLDGGDAADDGVVVLADPDSRIHRLRVYEDLDGSRSYSGGDIVRLDRGGEPAIHGIGGPGVATIERCCLDLDGGGPEDDGLLVIGVAPDRVLMAAVYETGPKARTGSATASGWPLR